MDYEKDKKKYVIRQRAKKVIMFTITAMMLLFMISHSA